jgi:RNA polymerase sigma-70 factor (ECF subfamily)
MVFLSDNMYIDRVLAGDIHAFTGLVNKYKDMVFTLSYRLSGNREDAEEIAQDVFLKTFRSLDTFRKDAKFKTWLYRIAYNTSISFIRKSEPGMTELDEEVLADTFTGDNLEDTWLLSPDEQKDLINKALASLRPEDNLLITLFYRDGCSVEELEEITAQSKSNIKVRLHRIRKKLAGEIQRIMNNELKAVYR